MVTEFEKRRAWLRLNWEDRKGIILAAIEMHMDLDDASLERAIQMVMDDVPCEHREVIEALRSVSAEVGNESA